MLLARGIDVSDHLGTAFGIPPPRSRRDASAALPPRSLQARWPGAQGALAPGGVAKRSSAADSKAVAHQGHCHLCPTVSPPPSAALRAQPLICPPSSLYFLHPHTSPSVVVCGGCPYAFCTLQTFRSLRCSRSRAGLPCHRALTPVQESPSMKTTRACETVMCVLADYGPGA